MRAMVAATRRSRPCCTFCARSVARFFCCPCSCCNLFPRRLLGFFVVLLTILSSLLLMLVQEGLKQQLLLSQPGASVKQVDDDFTETDPFVISLMKGATGGMHVSEFSQSLVSLLSESRSEGPWRAMSLSWERLLPTIHMTFELCLKWVETLYPLVLFATSLWVELLQRIIPPLAQQLRNTNPLVAWVLAAVAAISIVLLLVGRECQRRKIFHRVYAWYSRKTDRWVRIWRSFQKSVLDKSILAGKMLPHLILASVFVVIIYAFTPDWIDDALAEGQTIALTGLLIPLAMSIRELISMNGTFQALPKDSRRNLREWLSYWTMIGFASLVWHFPLLGPQIVQSFKPFRLVVLFFVIWLQFPLTNGASVGLQALKHLIGRYTRIHRASMTPLANSSFILRALVAMGTITDEQRVAFTQVIMDGGNIIILSAVFLVTPGFVTEIGCLLAGVAYPIYASVASVASAELESGKEKQNAHAWWLTYWVVYAMLSLCHDFASIGLSWLPLWYHARLVAIVWLQLPYFRGANVVFQMVLRRVSGFHAGVVSDSIPTSDDSLTRIPLAATHAEASSPNIHDSVKTEKKVLTYEKDKTVVKKNDTKNGSGIRQRKVVTGVVESTSSGLDVDEVDRHQGHKDGGREGEKQHAHVE